MSYTLENIRKEYDRLDTLTGVDTGNIKLSISHRCYKRYGRCRYENGKAAEIIISDFILEDEKLFWDVIRHEYAHALVRIRRPKEKHGHDSVFYAACREVGCPETRLLPSTTSPVAIQRRENRAAKKKPKPTRYYIVCDNCGTEWGYKTRTPLVKALTVNPTGGTCPVCNTSRFKVYDLLVGGPVTPISAAKS